MSKTNNEVAKDLLTEIEVNFDEETIEELEDHLNDTDFEMDIDGATYRFIHDSEIENAFKEYMESYIDDCVLPEIPEYLQAYFDSESFISDTRINDGYSIFASYNGNHEEVGSWNIFRTN